MKRVFGISRKFIGVASAVFLTAFTIASCSKNDDSNNSNSNMYSISGNASGSQVVPAVSGNGSGAITGTYNANTGVFNYTNTWTGLSGAPTSGGFYSGASGTSGTAVGSPWSMGTNLGTTGTYTGTMTLTNDQWTQLRNGNWYYSLGTASHSGGEVRGQITATQMQ